MSDLHERLLLTGEYCNSGHIVYQDSETENKFCLGCSQ